MIRSHKHLIRFNNNIPWLSRTIYNYANVFLAFVFYSKQSIILSSGCVYIVRGRSGTHTKTRIRFYSYTATANVQNNRYCWITFTCAPFFCGLRLWYNLCYCAKLILAPTANIVLLVLLIFQILFRINLVSVIKCY